MKIIELYIKILVRKQANGVKTYSVPSHCESLNTALGVCIKTQQSSSENRQKANHLQKT